MTIQQQIFALQDKPYGEFQSRLLPTIAKERIIGVRIPVMRKLAKQLTKEEPEAVQAFLEELPHTYYDEDILHAILISEIKDYDRCIRETERFLPYIDNWAVCDIMSPKVFKRHRSELIEKIRGWSASEHTYTCRFGMEMLMSFYLDEGFQMEDLDLAAGVRREEYYVKMMAAWYFATALAKQYDAALPYLRQRRLDRWTHNKTIQKAVESYRITPEQKDELRSLRWKDCAKEEGV